MSYKNSIVNHIEIFSGFGIRDIFSSLKVNYFINSHKIHSLDGQRFLLREAHKKDNLMSLEEFRSRVEWQRQLVTDFLVIGSFAYLLTISIADMDEQKLRAYEGAFYDYNNEILIFRYSLAELLKELNKYFSKHQFGYFYHLVEHLALICEIKSSEKVIPKNLHPEDTKRCLRFIDYYSLPLTSILKKFHKKSSEKHHIHLIRSEQFKNNVDQAITLILKQVQQEIDAFYDEFPTAKKRIEKEELSGKNEIDGLIRQNATEISVEKFKKDIDIKISRAIYELQASYGFHCHHQLIYLKLWGYAETGFTNSQIKAILSKFSRQLRTQTSQIKIVKKISYDAYTGLQVDVLAWVPRLWDEHKIEIFWYHALKSISPNANGMFYKELFGEVMDMQATKTFIERHLTASCLFDAEIKLDISGLRNFSTSRLSHVI